MDCFIVATLHLKMTETVLLVKLASTLLKHLVFRELISEIGKVFYSAPGT